MENEAPQVTQQWILDDDRLVFKSIKINPSDSLKKDTWQNAYKKIVEKIKVTQPDKIAGLTGDLTNMETLYTAKEFFNKTIKSKYLDSRSENIYVNYDQRENYIFNCQLNGIEESDLIILIGTNPRYESTILNAR